MIEIRARCEGDVGEGIAHEAEVLLFSEYPESGFDRAFAMLRAIDSLDAGDVLLLEMQDYGDPTCGFQYSCLAPAEVNPEVWTLTRMASDLGIVVVVHKIDLAENVHKVGLAEECEI